MIVKKNSIRILVVEDQAVVRAGLVAIFKYLPEIEVVGQAKNGIEALALFEELAPDIVLLDLMMPEMDGLTTIPKLLEIDSGARILIMTGFGEADNVYEAIRLGASGILVKDSAYEQLLEAIHDVANGKEFIPASIAMRMVREHSNTSSNQLDSVGGTNQLTTREMETLQLIAQGMSNQEIADKLVVHERTIAKYVSNILQKLGLENRTQAALYALRNGISDLK
jgi:DNA-binding NarL/FixJ family response regulator